MGDVISKGCHYQNVRMYLKACAKHPPPHAWHTPPHFPTYKQIPTPSISLTPLSLCPFTKKMFQEIPSSQSSSLNTGGLPKLVGVHLSMLKDCQSESKSLSQHQKAIEVKYHQTIALSNTDSISVRGPPLLLSNSMLLV